MSRLNVMFVVVLCTIVVTGRHRSKHHQYIETHVDNLQLKEASSLLEDDDPVSAKKVRLGKPYKRGTNQDAKDSDKKVEDATSKLKAEIGKINVDEFTATDMIRAKGGVETSLNAVEGLYDKYKKNDKLGMAISGITIVSGLATVVGGPVGYAVAMTLSLFKLGVTLIDKRLKKPEVDESTKLQKVIEKALQKFQESGLKAEWNGYERLTDLYLKHLEFVDHFDDKELQDATEEQQKIFKMDEMGGLSEVKEDMFDVVTPQIYKVLMSSSQLLGKVEYEISTICDFEIEMKKVNSKFQFNNFGTTEQEPTPTEEELKEKHSLAKSCLGMYELYSKISSFHYQTYLKSLKAISGIIGEKDEKPGPETSTSTSTKGGTKNDKETSSKRKAFIFMELLLDMIQNSREHNKKIFKPFLSPFSNYKMRYTVNYYHNYAGNYEHLSSYLNDLYSDKKMMEEVLNDVMLCSQPSLFGSCYVEENTDSTNLKEGNWRSAYIPIGKSITVTYKSGDKDIQSDPPIQLIGPSSMGMLFALREKDKVQDIKEKSKVTIAASDAGKKKFFKMCATHRYNLDETDYQTSACTMVEFKEPKTVVQLENIKSPTIWKGKNISIASDEADLAFVGTGYVGTEFKKPPNVRWGPFFSPRRMAELPGSATWDTITVYRYKIDAESDVKKQEDKGLFCNGGNNLLCQDDFIDKKLFVKICKKPELQGYCEEVPVIRSEIEGKPKGKVVNLKVINGYDLLSLISLTDYAYVTTEKKPGKYKTTNLQSWNNIDNSIWMPIVKDKKASNLLKSMMVPEDVKVELYTELDGAGEMYGPYKGPLTVDHVDGNDLLSNLIKSVVIKYSPKESKTQSN